MRLPTTCSCGKRLEPRERCACKPRTEAHRLLRQPYRKGYTTAEYRHNKGQRYQMARGRCEVCGAPLTRGWNAHHIRPLRDGGDDHIENLRALCRGCHDEVHRRR